MNDKLKSVGLDTPHGRVPFPTFFPDATRAVVKALDAVDLENCGVSALMVNIFHLSNIPGTQVISRYGGVHRYMGWDRPIASDSGGFQLFSLLQSNKKYGSISPRGFTYRQDGRREKKLFTPSKSIHQQLRLGSDILFCLDHCTHPDETPEIQAQSVQHTIKWAHECKAELERALDNKKFEAMRPKLFAVVQGGQVPELRRKCADSLLEIGFDGYGFGGWPIDEDGRLVEMVYQVAELLPPDTPKHALGIGKPENIVAAWRAGYTTFDSSLPTRDARRRRLFIARDLESPLPNDGSFYKYLYIGDDKHRREDEPIDPGCSCLCCMRYSRAYLHHLFHVKDCLAYRLATLHNLYFLSRLMRALELDNGSR